MRILRKMKSKTFVAFWKSVRAVRFHQQALFAGDRMVSAFGILRQFANRRLRHTLCSFGDFHGRRDLKINSGKGTKKIASMQMHHAIFGRNML